jgi:hypothetical protein
MHVETLHAHSYRATDGSVGRGARRRGRTTRGQALVELALLLPVLVLIFATAADLGRAFTAYIEIGSAAREGAAYGSQNTDTAQELGEIENRARAATGDIWGIQPQPVAGSCVILDGNSCSAEDGFDGYSVVWVDVSYTFSPILGDILGVGSITMERTAKMRVIN